MSVNLGLLLGCMIKVLSPLTVLSLVGHVAQRVGKHVFFHVGLVRFFVLCPEQEGPEGQHV